LLTDYLLVDIMVEKKLVDIIVTYFCSEHGFLVVGGILCVITSSALWQFLAELVSAEVANIAVCGGGSPSTSLALAILQFTLSSHSCHHVTWCVFAAAL